MNPFIILIVLINVLLVKSLKVSKIGSFNKTELNCNYYREDLVNSCRFF